MRRESHFEVKIQLLQKNLTQIPLAKSRQCKKNIQLYLLQSLADLILKNDLYSFKKKDLVICFIIVHFRRFS